MVQKSNQPIIQEIDQSNLGKKKNQDPVIIRDDCNPL